MFAYISGSPFVFIELYGVAPQNYGYLFGLNIVGLVVGSLVNARLVMRVGALRMLTAGATIVAVAGVFLLAAGLSQVGGLLGLVIPLFFFVGSLSLIGANAIAIASTDFSHHAGTVAAVFGAAQFGFGAVTGLIVGQLHDGTPVPMSATIAACGLATLAAILWLRRTESRRTA